MCLAFLALPVTGAGAATSPTYATGIQIGPLAMGHGYKLTISDTCNAPGVASAVLSKSGRGYTIGHYYNYYKAGKGSNCKTSRKLGSGSITLSWGTALSGKLRFANAGRRRRLACDRTTIGRQREATGTGTLKIAIHPGVFGRFDLHRVKGQIQEISGDCGGAGASGVSLGAGWETKAGRAGLQAYKNSRGKKAIYADVPDNLGSKVLGTTDDVFRGSGVFSFQSNLSSGRMSAFNPFLTGSLKYTATGQCSAGTTMGKMTGRMVLHDPVSGRFVYASRRAKGPYMDSASGNC